MIVSVFPVAVLLGYVQHRVHDSVEQVPQLTTVEYGQVVFSTQTSTKLIVDHYDDHNVESLIVHETIFLNHAFYLDHLLSIWAKRFGHYLTKTDKPRNMSKEQVYSLKGYQWRGVIFLTRGLLACIQKENKEYDYRAFLSSMQMISFMV